MERIPFSYAYGDAYVAPGLHCLCLCLRLCFCLCRSVNQAYRSIFEVLYKVTVHCEGVVNLLHEELYFFISSVLNDVRIRIDKRP